MLGGEAEQNKTCGLVMQPCGVYWKHCPEFITELVQYIGTQRVLEVFSGNGYLASLLNDNNVDIKPTSLFAGHDAHDLCMYYDVEELDAFDSVLKYHKDYDMLLLSWPTTTIRALYAVQSWSILTDKNFIFIGEVTDLEKRHFGGCATDEFFTDLKIVQEFESYRGNYLEKAFVAQCK